MGCHRNGYGAMDDKEVRRRVDELADHYGRRLSLSLLRGSCDEMMAVAESIWHEVNRPPDTEPPLERPLAQTGLSNKTVNTLEDIGVLTIGDYQARDDAELLQLHGLGQVQVSELRVRVVGYLAAEIEALLKKERERV